MIEKLRNVKNEISYINYKTEQRKQVQHISNALSHKLAGNEVEQLQKEHGRLNKLYDLKNTITNEIIELQNAYSIMDTIFYREISVAEKKQNRWWFCLLCFYWNKTDNHQDYIGDLVQQLPHALRDLLLPRN